jgi:ribonuclease E
MPKKMLIDATHAEETRVVVVDGNRVEEFDFESENKRQLAGNIYLAKVTRVEPSLQAAFVDYGGNRHGFLAFSEIHPDYYQIPVADREALLEEERAYAEALAQEEEEKAKSKPKRRSRRRAAKADSDDLVVTQEVEATDVSADDEASPEDVKEATDDTESESVEATADEAVAEASETEETPTNDSSEEEGSDTPSDDDEEEDTDKLPDATERDDAIESVADEDVTEEIRPRRKQRPRRYKIQEVIKVRQILLVQVVKEERGNKGAALTTYLSLAGRYCVLMPNTARGGGISRKITNAADRKKLKDIAGEIEVPTGAGLIIRTAGAKRTKSEIKRDYEYLQRMWEQIRELTLKSIAPAKIYEEGNLIKRSIRDLYNREIDEVFVEGEAGYRVAKDFMKMIMPSHAKNVKHYQDGLPLFARYQVESYLAGMFNPTVQLKSGGYIVIGVTEALVAIDVNSGRATKEGSIEDTALKTNLEAAEEVARQLRLRDLAGLIVIDFIDMEERKNNTAVEKRFKEKLKTDRARIQVGRISGFGLLEMSRQRLRPGMLEASTQPCPHCHGTGLIRSDDSLGLTILRQIEEEGVRRKSPEVLVKAPVGIVNFLMNQKREHIAQIEARYGLSVRIEGDPFLVSPDFSIEKFKTATRVVPEATAPVVSVDAKLMEDLDEAAAQDAASAPEADEDAQPKKRRRRRRRRRGGAGRDAEANGVDTQAGEATPDANGSETETAAETSDVEDQTVAADAAETETVEKPKRRMTRKRASKTKAAETVEADVVSDEAPEASEAGAPEEKPKKPRRRRTKKTEEETADLSSEIAETSTASETETPEEKPKPKRRSRAKAKPKDEAGQIEVSAETVEPAEVAAPAEPEVEAAPAKPKRKGWWSLGR